MSVATKEALAATKQATGSNAVRQLQQMRVRAVIRASHCCHKPPPPRVVR